MLSQHLLGLLRAWWKVGRPQGWLFPGQNPVNPLTPRQLNRACHAAARMAEIDKPVHLHTLRHCFATLLLEQKTDIRVIQSLPRRRPGYCSVLGYLSCYTHRVAIANDRLIAFNDHGVTFKWKDYRANGADRYKVMKLAVDEFIRRFLIQVLPDGFHRIRHYGLFANGGRADNIARARGLLNGRRHSVCRPRPTAAATAGRRRSRTLVPAVAAA
jgi:Putative transposase/Phage integrase family